MEKYMKQYDKEYMKMAMLQQEETFRQQVHELHRLYRVQKLSMREMKNDMKRQQSSQMQMNFEVWNVENEAGSNRPCYSKSDHRQLHRTLDLELPAEEHIGNQNGDVMLEDADESDLELTLATGISKTRHKKKESSFTSDSATSSFSSSSTESGSVKLNGKERAILQVPNVSATFRNDMKGGFEIQEGMKQDGLKQPPWLFQCLSLNMAT